MVNAFEICTSTDNLQPCNSCCHTLLYTKGPTGQVAEARGGRPTVAALVGILLAVAAVALGVGYYLATPGALQHLCTAGTQVLPEAGKLQHNAAC